LQFDRFCKNEARLFGGANDTLHAHYVARIQPVGPNGEQMSICGGAIINTTLILTTASCMFGWVFSLYSEQTGQLNLPRSAASATVMAGQPCVDPVTTTTTPPPTTTQTPTHHPDLMQHTKVTQIFYHPKFYQNTKENDIAILRVDPPFNTSGKICKN